MQVRDIIFVVDVVDVTAVVVADDHHRSHSPYRGGTPPKDIRQIPTRIGCLSAGISNALNETHATRVMARANSG